MHHPIQSYMGGILQGRMLCTVLSIVGSIVVLSFWGATQLRGEPEHRHMIGVSVLTAFPILLATFSASALARLWRNSFSVWLLRNRKYVGLAFSAVMVWQILFIARLISSGGRLFAPGLGKYFIVSDLIGYALLLAMTATSFDSVRSRMSRGTWSVLHRTGIYYIWFIFTYSFVFGVYFTRGLTAFGYSVLLLAALGGAGLRLRAWWVRRSARDSRTAGSPNLAN